MAEGFSGFHPIMTRMSWPQPSSSAHWLQEDQAVAVHIIADQEAEYVIGTSFNQAPPPESSTAPPPKIAPPSGKQEFTAGAWEDLQIQLTMTTASQSTQQVSYLLCLFQLCGSCPPLCPVMEHQIVRRRMKITKPLPIPSLACDSDTSMAKKDHDKTQVTH